MEYASEQGMIVFTHDLGFSALARGPSITAAQHNLDPYPGHALHRHRSRAQLEAGALVTVDPNRNRIRMLPLS